MLVMPQPLAYPHVLQVALFRTPRPRGLVSPSLGRHPLVREALSDLEPDQICHDVQNLILPRLP